MKSYPLQMTISKLSGEAYPRTHLGRLAPSGLRVAFMSQFISMPAVMMCRTPIKLLLRTPIRYREDTDQETAPWRLHKSVRQHHSYKYYCHMTVKSTKYKRRKVNVRAKTLRMGGSRNLSIGLIEGCT